MDSFLSLILVGVLCFIMTWSQGGSSRRRTNGQRKEAERAEELTRSQNRFFSSMSHEIRTPINSILGLNELILRDQSASDEIVRDASGIQGSGKMLLALINDILDFSKIEGGKHGYCARGLSDRGYVIRDREYDVAARTRQGAGL